MSENLKNVQGKRKPDALVDPKLLEGWHKDKTVGGEDYYWHDDGVTTSWTLPNWYPEGWARKKEGDEMPEEADEDLLPGWNVSVTENDQIFYWHDDMTYIFILLFTGSTKPIVVCAKFISQISPTTDSIEIFRIFVIVKFVKF